MRTSKYFLADVANHNERVHQLYFIGAFLQEKGKNRVFVKLDSIYADKFPEYSNYVGRTLRLLNSIHGMTNSGKLFDCDSVEGLLEAGLIQSQYQMSIYYKYAPYIKNYCLILC